MGLFDIDFAYKVSELSPPSKRGSATLQWLCSLVSPVKYLRDKFLGDYRQGSAYTVLDNNVYNETYVYGVGDYTLYSGKVYTCNTPGTTGVFNATYWDLRLFALGEKISYKQVVYASLIADNSDIPSAPNWEVYLPSFIGVDTRVLYNGQYLTLTYALNQLFGTNYNQPLLLGYSLTPDSEHAAYSDIYITNLTYVVVGFIVGKTEPYSSTVGQTNSSAAVGFNYPFQTVENFTIHVPSEFQTDSSDAEISFFVKQFIPAGINFIIEYY